MINKVPARVTHISNNVPTGETPHPELSHKGFKSSLKLEKYLAILQYAQRVSMTSFTCMCRNHKLPIEAGSRHGVLRENRICTYYNEEMRDEFH